MSQILNIFQKDARHHWPEILVSISLLITFVAEQPHKWTGHPYGIRLLNFLVKWLPGAMILIWAFLIIRLIQTESLVGDRQFWITRPYRWHKLLAAKLFSIGVFIHLPFFVSQLVLLKMARFPVLSSIPGLLFVHLLFFMAIVVPSITVGTITSGIGQAALVGLGALLVLMGLAGILFMKLSMDVAADSIDWLIVSLGMGSSGAVIFLQYLHRRTRLAWFIIGSTVTLIALVMTLAPYERIIGNWFPPPESNRPIPAHFQLDRTLSFAHSEDWTPAPYEGDISVEIPLEISDLDDKLVIEIVAMKLDLDLPDGKPWTSDWHSIFNRAISLGRTRVWPNIDIKKAVFAGIKDSPVKARVTLGLNVYRLGAASQVTVSNNRLGLTGGARCLNEVSENLMHCFSALSVPGSIFLAGELPNSSCPIANDVTREPWAASPAVFARLGESSSPDLDFTPIQQFDIELSRFFVYEDHQVRLPLCSGTHLFLSRPKFLYSVGEEIDLGEIRLANYHPSFPRMIIPPAKRPLQAPSDSISQNFRPEVVPAKMKIAAD